MPPPKVQVLSRAGAHAKPADARRDAPRRRTAPQGAVRVDRPYDPTTDADLQFFPQEQHVNTQADATPEDPTAAGDEDDYDEGPWRAGEAWPTEELEDFALHSCRLAPVAVESCLPVPLHSPAAC
jgi:hypothetical protein